MCRAHKRRSANGDAEAKRNGALELSEALLSRSPGYLRSPARSDWHSDRANRSRAFSGRAVAYAFNLATRPTRLVTHNAELSGALQQAAL